MANGEKGKGRSQNQRLKLFYLLDEYGYETQYDGRTRGWRIIEREFDTQELQLLIDSVQSSRFITQKKANQEYSLVQRKKFIGMKTAFCTYQSHLHCIGVRNKKAENRCAPIRNWQPQKTSAEAAICQRSGR